MWGIASVLWGDTFSIVGGQLQYCGGYSVHWGITSVHVGVNISTVEGIQYSGGKNFNWRSNNICPKLTC